jgi:hypothetical protein
MHMTEEDGKDEGARGETDTKLNRRTLNQDFLTCFVGDDYAPEEQEENPVTTEEHAEDGLTPSEIVQNRALKELYGV